MLARTRVAPRERRDGRRLPEAARPRPCGGCALEALADGWHVRRRRRVRTSSPRCWAQARSPIEMERGDVRAGETVEIEILYPIPGRLLPASGACRCCLPQLCMCTFRTVPEGAHAGTRWSRPRRRGTARPGAGRRPATRWRRRRRPRRTTSRFTSSTSSRSAGVTARDLVLVAGGGRSDARPCSRWASREDASGVPPIP